jgi:bla regulator protein blaR1
MSLALVHVVWAWSLQVAVLGAAGALLATLLRARNDPRARLLVWRLVLVGSMLLPLATLAVPVRPPTVVTVRPAEAAAVSSAWSAAPDVLPVDGLAVVILAILAAGLLLRIARLAKSALALRRLARGDTLASNAFDGLAARIGARARLVAAPVSQPFTFGTRRPVIVVPQDFAAHPEAVRQAVLAHELLHVRRRDWLHSVVEDACAALLWFHPAVWFTTSELRLAREEIVDRQAARLVGSRRAYLQALLAFAERETPLPRALAFFRQRQLARRVAALSQEVSMSTRLLVSTAVAAAVVLAVAARTAQAAFPLPGVPVAATQDTGTTEPSALERLAYKVPDDAQPPRKVHDVRPQYPEAVRAVVTSAMFAVRVVVDVDGTVAEARIISQRVGGPPVSGETLARAVTRLTENTLGAVRQWRFEPPERAPIAMTITVNFVDPARTDAPPPPPPPPPPPDGAVTVPPVAIYQQRARFPPEALRAGAEGSVEVAITVGADGSVRAARVTRSHPAFDAAALEAARLWRFQPGTRSGTPVEVETVLEFTFTLRD